MFRALVLCHSRSDEGLTLETLETPRDSQFPLSTQLLKTKIALLYPPADEVRQFLSRLTPFIQYLLLLVTLDLLIRSLVDLISIFTRSIPAPLSWPVLC